MPCFLPQLQSAASLCKIWSLSLCLKGVQYSLVQFSFLWWWLLLSTHADPLMCSHFPFPYSTALHWCLRFMRSRTCCESLLLLTLLGVDQLSFQYYMYYKISLLWRELWMDSKSHWLCLERVSVTMETLQNMDISQRQNKAHVKFPRLCILVKILYKWVTTFYSWDRPLLTLKFIILHLVWETNIVNLLLVKVC